MFKKIIKPLIIALIFYILTVLYGLISFHPLPVIFNRGIRAFLVGFLLSFILKLIGQYINNNLEKKDDDYNDKVNQKAATEYQETEKTDKSYEEENQKNEKDFNPLDPPVLETEGD